jgi:hypothetical protein
MAPPTMEHPELDDLLQDAALVVDYAARMGRLPDNALLAAMAKARSALPMRSVPGVPAS